MNTETLRTFIAAAQIKNFTKTAEHLFIAQSTVTNRILDLESEIGKPLFTRKHKQIDLTEAGLQFLDYAKQLVDLETTALQTVRSSLSPDERLRIGTTNTIYECRLQHALRKWMKAKPLSTIILNIGHTAEMIESLKKGNLDMVFSFVSFYGDGYWCRPYYSEDLCLVCTAEDTTWADGISKKKSSRNRLPLLQLCPPGIRSVHSRSLPQAPPLPPGNRQQHQAARLCTRGAGLYLFACQPLTGPGGIRRHSHHSPS